MSYSYLRERTDDAESFGFGADSEIVGHLNRVVYAPGTAEQGADPFEGEGGEVVYFIETTKTWNQPEVVDAFKVEYRCQYWADKDDLENGPGDVSYESASCLYYHSLESAQRECDRLGRMDESYVFMFKADEVTA
jgi:hypothetical protein